MLLTQSQVCWNHSVVPYIVFMASLSGYLRVKWESLEGSKVVCFSWIPNSNDLIQRVRHRKQVATTHLSLRFLCSSCLIVYHCITKSIRTAVTSLRRITITCGVSKWIVENEPSLETLLGDVMSMNERQLRCIRLSPATAVAVVAAAAA